MPCARRCERPRQRPRPAGLHELGDALPRRHRTVLKAALRPILADPAYRLESREQWWATARALRDDAGFRGERYAALAVTGHRLYSRHQDGDAVPLYRHLIETGAWWDYVDEIASRRIGPIRRAARM